MYQDQMFHQIVTQNWLFTGKYHIFTCELSKENIEFLRVETTSALITARPALKVKVTSDHIKMLINQNIITNCLFDR